MPNPCGSPIDDEAYFYWGPLGGAYFLYICLVLCEQRALHRHSPTLPERVVLAVG